MPRGSVPTSGSRYSFLPLSTLFHQWAMVRISSSAGFGAGVATGCPPYRRWSCWDWFCSGTGCSPGIFGTFGAAEEEEERRPVGIGFGLGAWTRVRNCFAAGVATGAISQTSRWQRGAGNLTSPILPNQIGW
eukprot:3020625-Pyramimonas_sp.AAC.1